MSQTSAQDLTQMLIQLSEGKTQVVDDILPLIYDELRRLADNYLKPVHKSKPFIHSNLRIFAGL